MQRKKGQQFMLLAFINLADPPVADRPKVSPEQSRMGGNPDTCPPSADLPLQFIAGFSNQCLAPGFYMSLHISYNYMTML